MIKNGKNDGSGQFPMHKRWNGRMYVILYYADDGPEMNVFGGVYDNWKTPFKALLEHGYTVVSEDDEDQILMLREPGDPIKAYARIKQMVVNGVTLAGHFWG
ncbi:MAG: hypothetical protein IKU36_02300 [Bacteroidales bacterium]|nr:hypothetical protein [Bacteroidales bacterium]